MFVDPSIEIEFEIIYTISSLKDPMSRQVKMLRMKFASIAAVTAKYISIMIHYRENRPVKFCRQIASAITMPPPFPYRHQVACYRPQHPLCDGIQDGLVSELLSELHIRSFCSPYPNKCSNEYYIEGRTGPPDNMKRSLLAIQDGLDYDSHVTEKLIAYCRIQVGSPGCPFLPSELHLLPIPLWPMTFYQYLYSFFLH